MADISRIQIDERFGVCEASVVQICQKMPPTMNGHVAKGEWDDYCSKVDKDLKRLTSVRPFVVGMFILYVIVMVALYICVEHLGLLDEYRPTTLVIEILASVGILFAVIFLYVTYVRCATIGAFKRRTSTFNERSCPQLELKCNLPFFQFTGGIAKGWYVLVISRNGVVETA
ncbi:expressed unknown protein [Seminavis robusta]|uniref:Uncharacterized protein n=1 Tax=Seminavis robusta TaxID=568900 RepID=A0A9N8D8N5_9STRA|nr:expressed unknown protein [Seminavis robusta]|eukprot:Sro42_g025450.1 n/a (172) ;mRNA; r:25431-26037